MDEELEDRLRARLGVLRNTVALAPEVVDYEPDGSGFSLSNDYIYMRYIKRYAGSNTHFFVRSTYTDSQIQLDASRVWLRFPRLFTFCNRITLVDRIKEGSILHTECQTFPFSSNSEDSWKSLFSTGTTLMKRALGRYQVKDFWRKYNSEQDRSVYEEPSNPAYVHEDIHRQLEAALKESH